MACSVSFSVRLTVRDLYRAQMWQLTRGSKIVWVLLVLLVILLVNVAKWRSGQAGVSQNGPLPGDLGALLLLCGAWAALLIALPALILWTRFKMQKGLSSEIHYTISPQGIETEVDAAPTMTPALATADAATASAEAGAAAAEMAGGAAGARLAAAPARRHHLEEWPRILRVDETGADFYFFTSRQPTFVIPKRALAEPGQLERLREIIKDCCEGRVKLRT